MKYVSLEVSIGLCSLFDSQNQTGLAGLLRWCLVLRNRNQDQPQAGTQVPYPEGDKAWLQHVIRMEAEQSNISLSWNLDNEFTM